MMYTYTCACMYELHVHTLVYSSVGERICLKCSIPKASSFMIPVIVKCKWWAHNSVEVIGSGLYGYCTYITSSWVGYYMYIYMYQTETVSRLYVGIVLTRPSALTNEMT